MTRTDGFIALLLTAAFSGGIWVGAVANHHQKIEVFCESGTEVETGRQYELWSATCNKGSVYGPEVVVTMID